VANSSFCWERATPVALHVVLSEAKDLMAIANGMPIEAAMRSFA
jgi:hypothetical protein